VGYELEPDGRYRSRVRITESDTDRLFALAAASGAVLTEVTLERATLEDVFVETLARAEAG
jgi:hypothetical protein